MIATAAIWWILLGLGIGLAIGLIAFIWMASQWKWPG